MIIVTVSYIIGLDIIRLTVNLKKKMTGFKSKLYFSKSLAIVSSVQQSKFEVIYKKLSSVVYNKANLK